MAEQEDKITDKQLDLLANLIFKQMKNPADVLKQAGIQKTSFLDLTKSEASQVIDSLMGKREREREREQMQVREQAIAPSQSIAFPAIHSGTIILSQREDLKQDKIVFKLASSGLYHWEFELNFAGIESAKLDLIADRVKELDGALRVRFPNNTADKKLI
jgi:hypothetical protein